MKNETKPKYFSSLRPLIEFKRMHDGAKVPDYATPGSAGMDVFACIGKTIIIQPGDNAKIPIGWSVNIADRGIVAVLCSRSGMGLKDQIRLSNSIGIIDSDYQDEIGAVLHNDGKVEYHITPGAKIAQLVFMPVNQVNIMVVDRFSCETERRGGFGSTGV